VHATKCVTYLTATFEFRGTTLRVRNPDLNTVEEVKQSFSLPDLNAVEEDTFEEARKDSSTTDDNIQYKKNVFDG
jgi:hypothetical protein